MWVGGCGFLGWSEVGEAQPPACHLHCRSCRLHGEEVCDEAEECNDVGRGCDAVVCICMLLLEVLLTRLHWRVGDIHLLPRSAAAKAGLLQLRAVSSRLLATGCSCCGRDRRGDGVVRETHEEVVASVAARGGAAGHGGVGGVGAAAT